MALPYQVCRQKFALLFGGGVLPRVAGVALRGRRACGAPRSNSALKTAEFSTPRRAITGNASQKSGALLHPHLDLRMGRKPAGESAQRRRNSNIPD